MTNFKDYYAILEVHPKATAEEIKRAYRRLAFKYHPDTNKGNKQYEEKFKEVNAAFEILSDEQERKAFDVKYSARFQHSEAPKQEQRKTRMTANDILLQAMSLHSAAEEATNAGGEVNRSVLFFRLTSLLAKENIETLRYIADRIATRKALDVLMNCNLYLWPPDDTEIYSILLQVAGNDEKLRKRIEFHRKVNNIPKYIQRHPKQFAIAGLILFFVGGWTVQAINNAKEKEQDRLLSLQTSTTPLPPIDTASIYPSLATQPKAPLVKSANIKDESEAAESYSVNYMTGALPDCFKFKPLFDLSMDNTLRIEILNNTDAIVKLINVKTKKCIRCIYVRENSQFDMKNIPEGIYKVKIAYGRSWQETKTVSGCKGKFLLGSIYKEGSDTFDFRKQTRRTTIDGERYIETLFPSYRLQLSVEWTKEYMETTGTSISDEEFNEEEGE